MTNKVLQYIAEKTNGKCYQSFRYCADSEIRVPTLDYEDQKFTLVKNSCGETDTSLKTTKSIKQTAKKIINNESLFHFFLDGSRRTYKVDDIEINRNVYPVIAGQIGVACCERVSADKFICPQIDENGNRTFERTKVYHYKTQYKAAQLFIPFCICLIMGCVMIISQKISTFAL